MKVQEVDFAGHGEAHHVVEGSGDFGNLGELDAASLEVAVRATNLTTGCSIAVEAGPARSGYR